MDNPDDLSAWERTARATAWVRQILDIDLIGGRRELLTHNVGAKLAAEYHRLKTSVSAVALGAVWVAQRGEGKRH